MVLLHRLALQARESGPELESAAHLRVAVRFDPVVAAAEGWEATEPRALSVVRLAYFRREPLAVARAFRLEEIDLTRYTSLFLQVPAINIAVPFRTAHCTHYGPENYDVISQAIANAGAAVGVNS